MELIGNCDLVTNHNVGSCSLQCSLHVTSHCCFEPSSREIPAAIDESFPTMFQSDRESITSIRDSATGEVQLEQGNTKATRAPDWVRLVACRSGAAVKTCT